MRARRRKRMSCEYSLVSRVMATVVVVQALLAFAIATSTELPLPATTLPPPASPLPPPQSDRVTRGVAKSWAEMIDGYRRSSNTLLFPYDLIQVMEKHDEAQVLQNLCSPPPGASLQRQPDPRAVLLFLERELERRVKEDKVSSDVGGLPGSQWDTVPIILRRRREVSDQQEDSVSGENRNTADDDPLPPLPESAPSQNDVNNEVSAVVTSQVNDPRRPILDKVGNTALGVFNFTDVNLSGMKPEVLELISNGDFQVDTPPPTKVVDIPSPPHDPPSPDPGWIVQPATPQVEVLHWVPTSSPPVHSEETTLTPGGSKNLVDHHDSAASDLGDWQNYYRSGYGYSPNVLPDQNLKNHPDLAESASHHVSDDEIEGDEKSTTNGPGDTLADLHETTTIPDSFQAWQKYFQKGYGNYEDVLDGQNAQRNEEEANSYVPHVPDETVEGEKSTTYSPVLLSNDDLSPTPDTLDENLDIIDEEPIIYNVPPIVQDILFGEVEKDGKDSGNTELHWDTEDFSEIQTSTPRPGPDNREAAQGSVLTGDPIVDAYLFNQVVHVPSVAHNNKESPPDASNLNSAMLHSQTAVDHHNTTMINTQPSQQSKDTDDDDVLTGDPIVDAYISKQVVHVPSFPGRNATKSSFGSENSTAYELLPTPLPDTNEGALLTDAKGIFNTSVAAKRQEADSKMSLPTEESRESNNHKEDVSDHPANKEGGIWERVKAMVHDRGSYSTSSRRDDLRDSGVELHPPEELLDQDTPNRLAATRSIKQRLRIGDRNFEETAEPGTQYLSEPQLPTDDEDATQFSAEAYSNEYHENPVQQHPSIYDQRVVRSEDVPVIQAGLDEAIHDEIGMSPEISRAEEEGHGDIGGGSEIPDEAAEIPSHISQNKDFGFAPHTDPDASYWAPTTYDRNALQIQPETLNENIGPLYTGNKAPTAKSDSQPDWEGVGATGVAGLSEAQYPDYSRFRDRTQSSRETEIPYDEFYESVRSNLRTEEYEEGVSQTDETNSRLLNTQSSEQEAPCEKDMSRETEHVEESYSQHSIDNNPPAEPDEHEDWKQDPNQSLINDETLRRNVQDSPGNKDFTETVDEGQSELQYYSDTQGQTAHGNHKNLATEVLHEEKDQTDVGLQEDNQTDVGQSIQVGGDTSPSTKTKLYENFHVPPEVMDALVSSAQKQREMSEILDGHQAQVLPDPETEEAAPLDGTVFEMEGLTTYSPTVTRTEHGEAVIEPRGTWIKDSLIQEQRKSLNTEDVLKEEFENEYMLHEAPESYYQVTENPVTETPSLNQEIPLEEAIPLNAEIPADHSIPLYQEIPTDQSVPAHQEIYINEEIPMNQRNPIEEGGPINAEIPIQETIVVNQEIPVEEAAHIRQEKPIQETLPINDEMPIEESVPPTQGVLTVDVIPVTEENPVVEGLPVAEEIPITDEIQIVEEVPIKEETSKIKEIPTEEEILIEEEIPMEEEIPIKEEISIQNNIPLQEEVLVKDGIPVVEDVPIKNEETFIKGQDASRFTNVNATSYDRDTKPASPVDLHSAMEKSAQDISNGPFHLQTLDKITILDEKTPISTSDPPQIRNIQADFMVASVDDGKLESPFKTNETIALNESKRPILENMAPLAVTRVKANIGDEIAEREDEDIDASCESRKHSTVKTVLPGGEKRPEEHTAHVSDVPKVQPRVFKGGFRKAVPSDLIRAQPSLYLVTAQGQYGTPIAGAKQPPSVVKYETRLPQKTPVVAIGNLQNRKIVEPAHRSRTPTAPQKLPPGAHVLIVNKPPSNANAATIIKVKPIPTGAQVIVKNKTLSNVKPAHKIGPRDTTARSIPRHPGHPIANSKPKIVVRTQYELQEGEFQPVDLPLNRKKLDVKLQTTEALNKNSKKIVPTLDGSHTVSHSSRDKLLPHILHAPIDPVRQPEGYKGRGLAVQDDIPLKSTSESQDDNIMPLTTTAPPVTEPTPTEAGTPETSDGKKKKKKKKKKFVLSFLPPTTTPAPWPYSLASLAPFLPFPSLYRRNADSPPDTQPTFPPFLDFSKYASQINPAIEAPIPQIKKIQDIPPLPPPQPPSQPLTPPARLEYPAFPNLPRMNIPTFPTMPSIDWPTLPPLPKFEIPNFPVYYHRNVPSDVSDAPNQGPQYPKLSMFDFSNLRGGMMMPSMPKFQLPWNCDPQQPRPKRAVDEPWQDDSLPLDEEMDYEESQRSRRAPQSPFGHLRRSAANMLGRSSSFNLPHPAVPALPPAFEEMIPRKDETEAERAEREHKAVQRMIQLVNVMGSLQQFLSERTRSVVKKLYRVINEEETQARARRAVFSRRLGNNPQIPHLGPH